MECVQIAKRNIDLFASPRSPKCNFMLRPCKPKWIERKKYETLSSSSKNFWEQKNFGRRPPLYVFSATQNCSDWCLSLVFVGFNLLILCWLAGDEVYSFKFIPYPTFELWASLMKS